MYCKLCIQKSEEELCPDCQALYDAYCRYCKDDDMTISRYQIREWAKEQFCIDCPLAKNGRCTEANDPITCQFVVARV